jgi:hypothetical protein
MLLEMLRLGFAFGVTGLIIWFWYWFMDSAAAANVSDQSSLTNVK